jgi:hypothetical protein
MSSAFLFCDPRGWPVIGFPTTAGILRCHLWPVSWWQFEEALTELRGPIELDRDFKAVQTVVPHPKLEDLNFTKRDMIAVRGIRAAEAEGFAALLGRGWRLPRDTEWRMIHALAESADYRIDLGLVLRASEPGSPFVRSICTKIVSLWTGQPTLTELMLLDGNFLEWVEQTPGRYAGRGRQGGRSAQYLAWPQDQQPVKPLTNDRRPEFRFRCMQGPSG